MTNESFLKKYNMGVKIANVKLISKALKITKYPKKVAYLRISSFSVYISIGKTSNRKS